MKRLIRVGLKSPIPNWYMTNFHCHSLFNNSHSHWKFWTKHQYVFIFNKASHISKVFYICDLFYRFCINLFIFLFQLYKELVCPLDNFELLICSMGPEGKSFPFCPYCYNSPPFEGIENLYGASKASNAIKPSKGAGMPCFLCPHPTCPHSMISQGVCACPECDGTLVLDPVSAPKWRLYCNMCNCLVSLPEGAHRISTTKDHCPDCDSTILEVDFNKKTTPLKDGGTLHIGCILCDELLHSLVEMKHGRSGFRHRGRGRGRGRRGRGRGNKKQQDPKMSFRDFWSSIFLMYSVLQFFIIPKYWGFWLKILWKKCLCIRIGVMNLIDYWWGFASTFVF